MILDRLQVDFISKKDSCGDMPSMDESKVEIDTMHVDLQYRDYNVSTYGGEWSSSCDCCGDIDIAYYGIQIDDLTLEVSPKTALNLYKALGEHLKASGHDI